jgi:hypothetical protein
MGPHVGFPEVKAFDLNQRHLSQRREKVALVLFRKSMAPSESRREHELSLDRSDATASHSPLSQA